MSWVSRACGGSMLLAVSSSAESGATSRRFPLSSAVASSACGPSNFMTLPVLVLKRA
ncbi:MULTISPECIES: hypothetical protein [Streptomycetaceae]|uniref:hypothetical protein n=1 Tax=Streptomycetaceae TaxID=2062 RepID=UPI001301379C|nr:hypothetical protein [Streptomyces sp. CB02056]